MSDDLEIVGNDDLEARVVAVILGEASDFERAEVGRLCDETPELALFHRRLEMVDGILGETRGQKPDAHKEWRLSSDRREAILAKIESDEPVFEERKIIRPRFAAALAALAAMLMIGLLVSVQMKSLGTDRTLAVQEVEDLTSFQSSPSDLLPRLGSEADSTQRKLANPSSSMARVTAAEASSPTSVPVPEIADSDGVFGREDLSESSWGSVAAPLAPQVSSRTRAAPQENFDRFESSPGLSSEGSFEAEDAPFGDAFSIDPQLSEFVNKLPKLDRAASLNSPVRSSQSKEFYDLGDHNDAAEKESKSAHGFALDNSAARREMEQVSSVESEHDRAAKGQARAELLREVDAAWELKLPEEQSPIERQSLKSVRPIGDEQSATSQQDSTFSLNVSDVSFKLAKAALAKGEQPETVRVEEFVNAFEYEEEKLEEGERVGIAMEQAAHPFLSQRNLLRVSLQTAATGRASGVPLRLTVVLDKSGSMDRRDRSSATEEALRVLTEQLQPGDQVSLVGFARTPKLLADSLDGSKGEELLQILRETPSEGGTNVEEALKLAKEKAHENYQEGAQNRIILLTDGIANLGNAVPDDLMKLVEGMREDGIAFDACGVGVEGLNDDILEALTRKGDGRYYLLSSAADGGAEFAQQVAGALRPAAQNVKVQLEWNLDRVGMWRLYGYEKHELKKEDFRNDSVDAAEMAAEEEGVALYHVEVKPDGAGPLGVARVRFRDMASGEMVEREWEIPYVGEAPRLAEADRKLHLAGVAALTAEKLARSAVGERTEWDSLLVLTRAAKGQFPNQTQVQDLETMIEQARELE